ncbi:DENN domain and WD repeat-containing protein SCD1-like isoform X1 [Musa acuminata AAA Group]|uniref:UDENN domain-containing protein n=1 Tax=Musa acuminata subsp. malaccensis TaxID=214687 RepID=A0A804ITL0_MUSAM|nr:PREDICTED: DENN domain and WD repeat-containing protein SCD1 isoform X1 [Musa acuminata subsp. malaccensis]
MASASSRIFEYFVVCGIGPEIRTLEGNKGFQGMEVMYMPSLLDQYPPSNHSLYPPPPPQLPTCVLPAGVEFYSSGFNSDDVTTYPRSYPIVLTEGDGSKIYVACIAFRDPVCEDIIEAYQIPANSFADKCICVVSRSPSFQVLKDALEELFILCFSPAGSSKPLWDVIAYMVSNVPLPTPGKDRVLFAIENCLLSVEAPPKEGLPHADISFQPLVQCLDVDNLIRFFTAVLLERRILLRANKYSLLTLVSEAICHLIYPFRWQHVYIPLLFFSGVDYIDAPTPYMMGLHSGVDTSLLTMDGVVVVDLEYNRITTSEEIPSIPEPELNFLRGEILKLLHPNVIWIDHLKINFGSMSEQYVRCGNKPWGDEHDFQLRLIFLRFLALLLSGYRNFIEPTTNVFNSQAFLKKRSRATGEPTESMLMITQFLESQGFMDYLERCIMSEESSNNLLDKLQDATGRGQNPTTIFPSQSVEPEIITVAEPDVGDAEPGSRHCYKQFPSTVRTEEQEEKRRSILALASGAHSGRQNPSSPMLANGDSKAESLSSMERAAERERMVLDIKVKLQRLWSRLLTLGATEDPLSSFEYGTILALIESDAEGIGGSGFVECIREHIILGWQCRLTDEQFIAVKELLKTAINRASSRNDIATIRDALEVSAEMYRKDSNNVPDYVQRHLLSLSIWDELRFWDAYFEYLMEQSANKSANYVTLVTAQLIVIATHMDGLGLPDTDAWNMIEKIAEKNNLGYKQLIKLRALLSHIQQLRIGYWGLPSGKVQSASPYGLPSPHLQDGSDGSHEPTEASVVGRSWVHSMFSRDRSIRANSFSRVLSSDSTKTGATSGKADLLPSGQKKLHSSMRILKGHSGAITALHCVTRREVWDLVGDREDAGFFISGSTDCLVKIWDPSLRGSELRATLKGHTRPIRAINSDRSKVVSGSDDHSIIVWDKQTSQLLEELKGHEAPVSCVRMLSGERVLTAAHDGTVKMWDVRTDTCVATVGRCSNAVLCMEYDDSTGILAAAGRDVVANIWDIRSGRQMQKLLGHTKWIRSLRMVSDTILTGSDDWTARMWSVSRGTCEAVLPCHAGPILCVEYSPSDKGVITGSSDGLIKFWENEEGGMKCVKNLTIHSASVLSINAGEHWLGIGAADNSMSLFHRPQERLGGFASTGAKSAGWQLYRTPQKTVAMVRCVSSDLDRKRLCSGGRNGLLRLWEATINI